MYISGLGDYISGLKHGHKGLISIGGLRMTGKTNLAIATALDLMEKNLANEIYYLGAGMDRTTILEVIKSQKPDFDPTKLKLIPVNFIGEEAKYPIEDLINDFQYKIRTKSNKSVVVLDGFCKMFIKPPPLDQQGVVNDVDYSYNRKNMRALLDSIYENFNIAIITDSLMRDTETYLNSITGNLSDVSIVTNSTTTIVGRKFSALIQYKGKLHLDDELTYLGGKMFNRMHMRAFKSSLPNIYKGNMEDIVSTYVPKYN